MWSDPEIKIMFTGYGFGNYGNICDQLIGVTKGPRNINQHIPTFYQIACSKSLLLSFAVTGW